MVANDFNYRKDIEFEYIFSLMVKMTFILVVLRLTTSLKLEVEQFDVNAVFLHGDLEEDIYMKQSKDLKFKVK